MLSVEIETLPRLLTVTLIAERLGVPLQRVQNVIANRPHIRPRALAGNTRIYDAEALAMLRHEISKQDAQRAAGPD